MRCRPADELGDDELFTLAQLTEEFDSADDAFPLYEKLASRETHPLGARYAVGRLLLARDDPKGFEIIEGIMAEDETAVVPGCEIVVPYLQRQGRDDEAKRYIERYWQRRETEAQKEQERYTIRFSDKFETADLSAGSRARIVELFGRNKRVRRAYAARKALPDGETPLYVVGVEPARGIVRLRSDTSAADRELVETLARTVGIPEDVLFVPLNEPNKKLGKILRKVPDSKIYG